jgi:hypothetical protein
MKEHNHSYASLTIQYCSIGDHPGAIKKMPWMMPISLVDLAVLAGSFLAVRQPRRDERDRNFNRKSALCESCFDFSQSQEPTAPGKKVELVTEVNKQHAGKRNKRGAFRPLERFDIKNGSARARLGAMSVATRNLHHEGKREKTIFRFDVCTVITYR